MEWLHSENPLTRADAVTYLGSRASRPEAYDLLMQALDDEDERIRRCAVGSLGRLGDKRAVDRLVKELLDDSSPLQEWAAEALWEIGDARALEPLLSVLDRENPNLRKFVAMALGKMPDPRAMDALLTLLDDSNWGVRFSAVGSLVRQSKALGFDVRPVLQRVVAQDSHGQVRKLATIYLEDEFGEQPPVENVSDL